MAIISQEYFTTGILDMTDDYIKSSISKERQTASKTKKTLAMIGDKKSEKEHQELTHGVWLTIARSKLKQNRFNTPQFALLIIFSLLFAGSVFLFESIDMLYGPLYAMKIIVTSLFAVTLGFLLSIWWSKIARFDDKLKEAELIDREYRELLISYSDSLFDIINALNTLSTNPPPPFVVATDFMLGEYIHLLQSRLHRYGDRIAGLGLDATDFLDEKIRIFEGIRERASLSIKGMPKELETLLIQNLNLDIHPDMDIAVKRQKSLKDMLEKVDKQNETNIDEVDSSDMNNK
jgi:hypothetical protein